MAEPTKAEIAATKVGKAKAQAYGGNPLKPIKPSVKIYGDCK